MDDVSVVFCGEAGQGLQTIEHAITRILKNAGFCNFATKEYMSRVRGGSNSTEIRITNQEVFAFVDRIDVLILLSLQTFSHISNRISANTLIAGPLVDKQFANQTFAIDFTQIALDSGSKQYASAVAIGFMLGLLKVPNFFYEDFFSSTYNSSPELKEKNILAAQQGAKNADKFTEKFNFRSNLVVNKNLKNKILLNGSEALAYGAIAGGCNFISAYPMSPSTGVLTQLASLSRSFDIIVEQAEDEISAVNMAQGAWYTGGRALVTTSGGGFALMCEGLSLAGMTETPLVINIGQRPGPATGLPTRTEQGDLNLALYAGHGEFPRVIFAPGNLEQAFYLMHKSFNLADKYQIPAIILSDQFLVDSYGITEPFNPLASPVNEQNITQTTKDYKRYQFTENGISPRGIPNFGEGIVCVDSDEHTEEGYINEDFAIRTKMVQKRLQKFIALENEVILPTLIGQENYKILLVCWGSNYHVVKEALEHLQITNVSCLHFSQIFPLSQKVLTYFNRAEKVIVIENNATGQFAQLLKQILNINIDKTILKFNGLPFSVEEIKAAINEIKLI